MENRENRMVKIKMPKGAEFIIRSLENAGFEAYIVGGCVRDGILGREPEDWDVTTNAKPMEVKSVFPVTVDTGIEHGTVTVLVPPDEVERGIRSFEVTTYRIDGEYTDHRHPNAVSFTGSLTEDLARRDFTINAMAYHMERGIIDPFSGQEDLEKKIVRAVGRAEDRFREDALRMMRGIRFSAQLDFALDEGIFGNLQAEGESFQGVQGTHCRGTLEALGQCTSGEGGETVCDGACALYYGGFSEDCPSRDSGASSLCTEGKDSSFRSLSSRGSRRCPKDFKRFKAGSGYH